MVTDSLILPLRPVLSLQCDKSQLQGTHHLINQNLLFNKASCNLLHFMVIKNSICAPGRLPVQLLQICTKFECLDAIHIISPFDSSGICNRANVSGYHLQIVSSSVIRDFVVEFLVEIQNGCIIILRNLQ